MIGNTSNSTSGRDDWTDLADSTDYVATNGVVYAWAEFSATDGGPSSQSECRFRGFIFGQYRSPWGSVITYVESDPDAVIARLKREHGQRLRPTRAIPAAMTRRLSARASPVARANAKYKSWRRQCRLEVTA